MHNENNLVIMTNQIASFFETMPDQQRAAADIVDHIKRFWEPRMRRALMQHIDVHEGAGLKQIVLDALRKNREFILKRGVD